MDTSADRLKSNNIPYYLDKNLKINFDTVWNDIGKNKINEDQIYSKMKHELDNLKKIFLNTDTIDNDYNNILNLANTGLNLAIELCNYCIEMKFTSSMFVVMETTEYFDFFSHWTVYIPYKKACQYEKYGDFEHAMELYLNILRHNSPTGTSYYTNPFNLSINLFNYADALEIYNYLKKNYIENKVENLKDIYNNYSDRINVLDNYENNYLPIKFSIISILENNHGMLQTTLYNEIDLNNKESFRFILYYWEKLKIIKREKCGRSYKLYLT